MKPSIAPPWPPAPTDGPCLHVSIRLLHSTYAADTPETRDPTWWRDQVGWTGLLTIRRLPHGSRTWRDARILSTGHTKDARTRADRAADLGPVTIATPLGEVPATADGTDDRGRLRYRVLRSAWDAVVGVGRRVVEGVRRVA